MPICDGLIIREEKPSSNSDQNEERMATATRAVVIDVVVVNVSCCGRREGADGA